MTGNVTSGPSEVYTICPVCGHKTVDTHCKVRCPNCHAVVSNCGGD